MKLLKKIKPKRISQLVYVLTSTDELPSLNMDLDLNGIEIIKDQSPGRKVTHHRLNVDNKTVYTSNTYDKVHLLRTINEKSTKVIGDCFTLKEFRGKSIYPFMLQHVAKEILKEEEKVFILVSKENMPSIKGIEKSGFKYFCEISTLRLAIFYLFTTISYNPNYARD